MFRPMLRPATASAAVLTLGGIALYPKGIVYAESPESMNRKKPIYDYTDNEALPQKPKPAVENQNETPVTVTDPNTVPATPLPPTDAVKPAQMTTEVSHQQSPTPTDQLAAHIRQVRLFLYAQSLRAENTFNDIVSRAMQADERFTSTIASLAPPPESGEKLRPGSIYVLVAAMAGSIVARNKGIIMRAATPVAFGTVAAYTLLPVTMRNVGDLVWEYEKRVPALAEQHVRIRTAAEESWARAVAHSGYGREWMEAKIGTGREAVNEWLKKGR